MTSRRPALGLLFALAGLGAMVALLALLGIVAPGPLGAQEPPPPEPSALPLGTARLQVGTQTSPLRYLPAPEGPLFPLGVLVARAGGSLEPGLGASYTLSVGEEQAVIAPGSPAVTVGQEIHTLSRPPRVSGGDLLVPLEFLEEIYGPLAGLRFQWDPASRLLSVAGAGGDQVPVRVHLVHLQGVSTLVVELPTRPRHRIERGAELVEVRIEGGRLELPGELTLPQDPLVQRVEVTPRRLQIFLAPGAYAEDYALEEPFRLVFDIFRRQPVDIEIPATPETAGPGAGRETIVLDPGHGGGEMGALGPSGAAEKELTLLLARALQRELESRMPVEVVLTRNEDAELPLATRTAIANQNQADLFISIHLNSSRGAGAHGAETYFLSLEASDPRAALTAAQENRPEGEAVPPADGESPFDLELILWDLAQTYHLAESQRLAKLIQEELNQALELRDRGVKQAPFRVLMGAAMPAVLVELGFISNPEEEEKLQSPAYRSRLVEALGRAIERYRAAGAPAESAVGESRP